MESPSDRDFSKPTPIDKQRLLAEYARLANLPLETDTGELLDHISLDTRASFAARLGLPRGSRAWDILCAMRDVDRSILARRFGLDPATATWGEILDRQDPETDEIT